MRGVADFQKSLNGLGRDSFLKPTALCSAFRGDRRSSCGNRGRNKSGEEGNCDRGTFSEVSQGGLHRKEKEPSVEGTR